MNSIIFLSAACGLRADWTTYAHFSGFNATGYIYLIWSNLLDFYFLLLSISNFFFPFPWSCSIWRRFILKLIMYLRGILFFFAPLSSGLSLLSLLWPVHTTIPKQKPSRVVARIAHSWCLLLLGMFRSYGIFNSLFQLFVECCSCNINIVFITGLKFHTHFNGVPPYSVLVMSLGWWEQHLSLLLRSTKSSFVALVLSFFLIISHVHSQFWGVLEI